MNSVYRSYDELAVALKCLPGDRAGRMQVVVDVLWDALHCTGVSWVGFYVHEDGDELILGPRRDKPACSPIGLHGACGQAYISRKPLVVGDVGDLGADYIACDPRDRSEVVLPLFDESGTCWGVLDLDSHETDSFDDTDVEGLQRVLLTANLTRVDSPKPD
jgi:putative methionine-R-sulfoxide reductase with GAF domain